MEPAAGEQPDEFVEAVPAGRAVLEQSDVDEVVESVPGVLDRHPRGGGRRGGVEVPSRHRGQPPEHPP
ncbi:hypothetical protein ACFRIC_04115 [Streptomyces sp. NPDC056738]|uniref:hypothetical protein n=1 Tax=Streptomyces sp. NPDC056738 TaxID=3345933 RepID=UPI003677313A